MDLGEQLKELWRVVLGTLKAFRDERGTTTAAALAYSTFLSLIPVALLMLILVDPLASALNVQAAAGQSGAGESVLTRILDWLAPTSRDQVLSWLHESQAGLEKNTTSLGMLGFGAFVVTSVLLYISVEDALNSVWKSPKRRALGTRIAYFWCVATLVPVMGMLSISAVSGLPLLGGWLTNPTIRDIFQWAMSVALIAGMYLVLPVAHVSWRAAFWGGIVSGSLFELSKWGFAAYVSQATYYKSLFATSAAIPIFIIWTYLSWAIVLLGAHLARIVDGGLPKPKEPPPPERLAMAVAIEVARKFLAGGGPASAADIASKLAVPAESVYEAARRLCRAGLLGEVESGREAMMLLPATDPTKTPAIDVLVAARDMDSEHLGGDRLTNALTRMDAAARDATTDLTLAQLATRSATTVLSGPDPALGAEAPEESAAPAVPAPAADSAPVSEPAPAPDSAPAPTVTDA